MGSRYVVTGVELGMLIGMGDESKRKEVVDEIIRDGYLCQDIDKGVIIEIIKRELEESA